MKWWTLSPLAINTLPVRNRVKPTSPLVPPAVSEIYNNYYTIRTAMYLKSFIFLLCAYTLIAAKPVSVSLSSGDNMAERPKSIIRPSGDGGDPLKPTLTTEKRQAGSSSVTSGDGSNNTIVRDQQAGGNTVCNLSNYTSLLNAIQLKPSLCIFGNGRTPARRSCLPR